MGKKERAGKRTKRDSRKKIRVPELGYYLIVTDTEGTERCYFNGLHQSLPENIRKNIVIKVEETKTRKLVDKCLDSTVKCVTFDAIECAPLFISHSTLTAFSDEPVPLI